MSETSTYHIGIIMDGNGRWATNQGEPRLFGHSAGTETVMRIVRACPDLGVSTLTVFAFGITNWKRDKEEVDGLWRLFHVFLDRELTDMIENGVKLVLIGDRSGLPESVRVASEDAEKKSAHNTKFLLQVALNYDGVDEVARMTKRAVEEATAGTLSSDAITTEYVQSHLDTEAGNEPDILIRTGMQKAENGFSVWRGSAFLPIQSAQSVCVSSEVLWPDFTSEHLEEIIAFAKPKERLFGGQRK